MGQQNETRCYLVDHYHYNGLQASFIDLSGLYQKSGYEAANAARPNLLFNVSVCRPMHAGGPCDNSMICLYSNDSQLAIRGNVSLPSSLALFSSMESATPHYEGNDVIVIYPITAQWVLPNCGSGAYVKIRFRCPTQDQV